MSAKKKFEHMQDVTDTKGACSNEYSLSPSALLVYRGLVGDAGWHLVPQISKETDRHFCLHTEAALFSLSSEIFTLELRRVAVADFLLRNFCSSLLFLSSSGHSVRIIPPHSDQYIIERSHLTVSADDGTVSIEFNIQKQSADDDEIFFEKTLPLLVSAWATRCTENNSQLVAHWQCLEDQCALREMISNLGVSFVADGSILPRAGGNNDRALTGDNTVPFVSPASLRAAFTLPHRGEIFGMLIPKGVTVITGGGYHGKSTILNAIKVGIYNKIPGDGREFVVTCSNAVAIRSEDGRYVSGVNISPFIDNLPEVARIDPRSFNSHSASGSTSMAANIIESMEFSPDLFLLDEDTCASNFMIRDSRMRSMISNEPITPFIYRVNALHKEKGISTVVVIGGSGDWFDVQDTTIMMDNYNCLDVSKKARSICKTFCTGRVQFNGRGLVHQLPWPLADDPALVDSENSAFKGIVKARRCRYMSRMLCNITLPSNFNKGGSVTASEDGHSVTFCSTYSERTGYINDDIMKKRKIVSGSGDVANFGDDPSALGTGGLLVVPNCAERSITMDISKLEQRISTKEGALGIAFAIIFVESILDRSTQQLRSHVGGNIGNSYSTSQNAIHVKLTELTETRNDETEEAEREETMLCTASVACDDSVVADSRLQTLLQRFDNLRGSWNVRRREVNQPVDVAASSHEMQDIGNSADKLIDSERRQRIIDLETAHKIHREFLCRQDFTWPRKYEVAASINRLRGSYFTRKIFVG